MEFIVEDQPSPRIACSYRTCKASFSRKTDAHRHERQVHQLAKIFCKFAGCRFRGTVRAEVMRKHLKSKHFFEVQSTFQIDNDNLEGGLRKVQIPREHSTSKHKVDSFPGWNRRPLPNTTVHSSNDPHVIEHKLIAYSELEYDIHSETSSVLSPPDHKTWELSTSEHVVGNQQVMELSPVSESNVPINVASCNCFPMYCHDAALGGNCWGGSAF